MGITGTTRLAAVIGDPARHSLSPVIHNAAFAACGLDLVYVAFDVARGAAGPALDAMRTLGIVGYSVTMPHKADVAALVDERTPAAEALAAVNCVVNRGGSLLGDNTDGDGFLRGLAADTGLDPVGRRCAVLGAGGAARAVIDALARAGAADVAVVNRTAEAAARAASIAPVARVGGDEDLAAAALVVNATPVGMHGDPGLACDPALLRTDAVAVDLIYDPLVTPWMTALAGRGVTVANGISMLVHQAARQFEWWTGTDAPVPAMLAAVAQALGRNH